MKKICIFALLLSCLACSKIKDPQFKKLTEFSVVSLGVNEVTLKANANYFNPNAIGGELKSSNIAVNVNDVDLGVLEQNYGTKIGANSDFSIPIIVEFSPKEIFKKDGGLLNGILNAALNKKVDVKYKGHALIEIMDVDIKIPIEHEEVVHLKK